MTAATVEPATSVLARWSASLRYEDIPPAVREQAELCLLDGVGAALYGARQPWGRIAAEVATQLSGGGPATVWGTASTVSPSDAALANGTALHGFEIDDVHTRSLIHPGAVTIPAAVAVCEAEERDGRALLTAIVAGYEVGLRVGIAAGVGHGLRGYHPTGTVGCLAAGAAAASALGLSSEATMHALAVSATQAAGLYGARMGAMAKRLHAGRASQSGVLAALLAGRGFTGAADALEAPFGGFLSTLADVSGAAELTADLGTRWETLAVGFKMYAACASAHTIVDALDRLMRDGLRAAEVAHVTIRMSAVGASNVGWPYRPSGTVAAQMNGAYAAAVKLLDDEVFVDQYRDERLADPAVLEMIERIEIVHDGALDVGGAATRHGVVVVATERSGRTREAAVEQRRGSEHHPLSRDEIVLKFRRTAGASAPPERVAAIEEAIGGIAGLADVRRLGRLLAG
ncbi:MAG: MmgE/PrpD family protein [Chloroflexota bacterium]|nr:MmgE/PrpD family protein [Chloroflexota bacterium]